MKMKIPVSKFPEGSIKVPSDNLCDICKKVYASYYNTVWYIHFCSIGCFNIFIDRYNEEIDSIALEVKTAEELFNNGDEDEM